MATPSAQKGGGVEACSSTATTLVCPESACRVTRSRCVNGRPGWHAAIGGLWDCGSRHEALVDRPFPVRELQFCGRKGGMGRWAPPRRGTPRALHCNTQHSTAYGRRRMEPLVWAVTAYMHTNFGAVVDLSVSGSFGAGRQIRRRSDKGKKESWPAAWSLLQRPRFLEASCLPGCSFSHSNLQLVCLAEAMTIPSNFAGVASCR